MTHQARPRLTLDHVYVIVALALLALRPLLTPIPPNDFWWHMATGRLIAAEGQVPAVDSFSFTRAGEAFFNQGWLAQLLMYALYAAGQLPLVLIVQAAVIALAYGLLLRVAVLRTGRLRMSVALLLLTTMPLSFDNWTVRPQTYAFPIFAAYLLILTEYRLGVARRLWLLPILMVLWANIHGSFVLGLALIGIVCVGAVIAQFRPAAAEAQPGAAPGGPWPLVIWGAASALATLINPRGVEVLGYVRNLLGSSQVTTLVTEWAPPTIRDTGGLIFFIFMIGCFLAIAYTRRKPGVTDLLMLLSFLWLALGAVRNIVWFGFVATPILCAAFATILPEPRGKVSQGRGPLNVILVVMLGLMVMIGLPWFKPALLPPEVGALLSDRTPVAAVRSMQAQPDRPRRLFHEMGFGSYLIWAAPEQKVFIDPRIELYPFEQWRDYISLGQGSNVTELLDRYQIDGALLHIEDQAPLVEALTSDPAWQVRYRDEMSIYLTRR